MFVVMEKLLLMEWKERLSALEVDGYIELVEGLKAGGAYSAIAVNKELFKDKKFTIRTHPITKQQYVIRIK